MAQGCKGCWHEGGIAVVKHHDGFCLWPTSTTDHSIVNAGNENGKTTNIPRDFAKCPKLGNEVWFLCFSMG